MKTKKIAYLILLEVKIEKHAKTRIKVKNEKRK